MQNANAIYKRRCGIYTGISIFMLMLNLVSFAQTNARAMKYTTGQAGDPVGWQSQLRDRLLNVLKIQKLLQERKSIDFKPVVLRTEDKGTYLLKQIEFNSTSGRRMKVIVTIPTKPSGKLPAVVSIHGHGGTERIVYDTTTEYKGFAHHLASRNYITIAPFVSQHDVYEKGRLLMGERLFDCIRAVDFLETMPEVDTSRIGTAGLSLGGEMVMWLAASDTRIKAAVSAGFLSTMDQLENGHCMCWKFPGLRDLADFADIYSLIAPRPLMCQNGILEPKGSFYVPLARESFSEIQAIYADFKRPENVLLDVHAGEHEVDVPSLLYFFQKFLVEKPLW